MRNVALGFLMFLVLFVASCVIIDEDDPCFIDETGDLIIVNSTSIADSIPMDIYINSIFTGATIEPEGEYYEGQLPLGTYEIEGRNRSGMTITSKTVYLSVCDELIVELESFPISSEPCVINNTGNMIIKNVTNSVDSISVGVYINGFSTGVTIASGEQHYESGLNAGYYEIEGRISNGTMLFIKTIDLLQCDDLLVELGN